MSSITARFNDMRFGFRLKLAYARVLGLKRASYKEVWNRISPDHSLAMVGVAGTADAEAFYRGGEDSARALLEMLKAGSDDVILEIGCGVGRIGKYMAPQCKKWIGTDISFEMLRFARDNTINMNNVELIELEDCSLKAVASGSLDRVYCTAVFMHLDEWDRYRYVEETFRVLRPGGRCYFDNINLAGDVGWSIFQQMGKHDGMLRPPNISKSSTSEELRIYLERAGFTTIEIFPGSHFVAATGVKPTA